MARLGARGSGPLLSALRAGLFERSAQVLALQIALQARGLVQVPFLARALDVEEFGALTLATSVAGAGVVVSLLGLNTGFFLNYVRLDAPRSRSAVITVLALALPLVLLSSLGIGLLVASGGSSLWLRGVGPLAGPLALLIAADALREVAIVVPRARQDLRFHWANSLLHQYGGLAVGVALVLRGLGARGFLLGLGAGALASALWAVVRSLRRCEGPAAWDAAFAVAVARSSVPVVPLALAQMALLSLDYLYVNRFLGPLALASYGLAYTFASPVMLAVAALNFTLLPEYVSRQRKGEAELGALVERLLAWGFACGLAAVAAGVAFGPQVMAALAGERYRGAGELLPAILSAYVLFALGQVLHVVRSARLAEVRASAGVTVACALLSAGLGLWLIPGSGVAGAAALTLLSFVLYLLGMIAVARPALAGPIAFLRPGLPLAGLAACPLVLLLDASVPMRAALALLLSGLALHTLARHLLGRRAADL